MVSIHKFRVYKTMSRPGVNKSLECDFIKVILTKDQERSKGVRETKSGCIELNRTHCYTEKFNAALSLCRVPRVTFYFSKSFLEAVAEVPWSLEETSLLLGTEVQLVVSCTAIEAQVVFEMLLMLVTGQLAIAGQLGREVYLRSIRLLLGNRGQR